MSGSDPLKRLNRVGGTQPAEASGCGVDNPPVRRAKLLLDLRYGCVIANVTQGGHGGGHLLSVGRCKEFHQMGGGRARVLPESSDGHKTVKGFKRDPVERLSRQFAVLG